MFIGHYAAAFAAHRISGQSATGTNRPRPSLGTFFLAAQWVDLVWPVFVLLGIERVEVDPGNTPFTPLDFIHYPYTHSLLAAVVWSVGFAAVYRIVRGNTQGALWLGAAVFSHWMLDFLSHRPDLPLAPGMGPRLGLGLWYSPVATVLVEGILFAGAWWLYVRFTRPRDKTGRYALWALGAFLVLTYIANIAGPLPPSGTAVAATALGLWLLVPWAYWIDRHRALA